MKINVSGNTYIFEIESYSKYTCSESNILKAKELYLKTLSDQIDDVINEQMLVYSKLKDTVNS